VSNLSTPAAAGYSAEPFLLEQGRAGVLLLHGYSGSPGELWPIGQALRVGGYTIHAPLLAGHGGTMADLHGVRWEQWLASATEGLRVLQKHCDEVFVCGFSLGGLLALRLAAMDDGARLAGLIALAPALILRGGRLLHVAGVIKHIKPWYYPLARADFSNPEVRAAVRQHAPQADLDDPAVVEQVRRAAKVPVGSLYELARLQRRVRRDLPRVTLPALIMQGRADRTVDPRGAAEVVKGVASRDRRLVWFEHSGHQLPNEAEREQVWATAIEWLGQHRQLDAKRD
jgi:carboxylesterase